MKPCKTILAFALMLLCFVTATAQKATVLLVNAKVVTLNDSQPNATAIAIQNDKILATGEEKALRKYVDKKTKVVDLHGKTVIPGLYDSHLHVIRAGRFYNTELRWDGVKTLSRALQMLREQAARTPKGQWVRVVGGWTGWQFDVQRNPSLEEINEATGSVPTFVLNLYGEAYLNKAGLKALGIDENTPNPPGGLVQKDRFGQPTGLLVAEPNAFILYSTLAKLPELTEAEKQNSTRLFMSELNALGVTSVMDAGGGFQNFPDDYKITDQLAAQKQLTVRLPYYLFAQKAGTELQDYQKWIATTEIGENHEDGQIEYHVQGGGENLVASGADFENFLKPRPELLPKMDAELKAVISTLVKNRWPFRLHATYNESISRFLNVIEAVNEETPLNGLEWFFDHAETVSDENLARIKALDGGISIQDRMAFQAESFISRYGKTAAEAAPPVKKMLAMGLKVGGGTDGTRVASYNPWVSLYWLVTGKSVGGLEFVPEKNRLDRLTALKIYTTGSASLLNQEKSIGKIAAGYKADLAVLSEDYLAVPAEKIKGIHAELTMLNGQFVYGSGVFSSLAPALPKAEPDWSPVNFYGGYQK